MAHNIKTTVTEALAKATIELKLELEGTNQLEVILPFMSLDKVNKMRNILLGIQTEESVSDKLITLYPTFRSTFSEIKN